MAQVAKESIQTPNKAGEGEPTKHIHLSESFLFALEDPCDGWTTLRETSRARESPAPESCKVKIMLRKTFCVTPSRLLCDLLADWRTQSMIVLYSLKFVMYPIYNEAGLRPT